MANGNGFLTPPQVSRRLAADHGREVPVWKVREVVDGLEAEIPRAGQYRLIPETVLDDIVHELERQGWLPDREEALA